MPKESSYSAAAPLDGTELVGVVQGAGPREKATTEQFRTLARQSVVTVRTTYTFVLADAGGTAYHTSGSAHTWTIPANGSVAYPIGTELEFVNENGGGNVTLAITTDTLRWGASTGSRTLAANGSAKAKKVAATVWRLTGDGIS